MQSKRGPRQTSSPKLPPTAALFSRCFAAIPAHKSRIYIFGSRSEETFNCCRFHDIIKVCNEVKDTDRQPLDKWNVVHDSFAYLIAGKQRKLVRISKFSAHFRDFRAHRLAPASSHILELFYCVLKAITTINRRISGRLHKLNRTRRRCGTRRRFGQHRSVQKHAESSKHRRKSPNIN
jgi:hypothetical protein